MNKIYNPGHRMGSVVLLFLLLITAYGCIKEKFDSSKFDSSISLNPGLAIPIGYSHLGIEKYLQDSTVKKVLRIGPDGFLSLYYYSEVTSGIMSSLLSLADLDTSKIILNQSPTVINLQSPGASFDLSDSLSIPFNLTQTDARIDSVSFLGGIFEAIQTFSTLTGTITYRFPGLVRNGESLNIPLNISDQGFTVALSDYTFIPEHKADNNILKCIINVHLQTPSGPINNGSELFRTKLAVSSPNYKTIYGDFGGYDLILPPFSFTTGIFNKVNSGNFKFTDPKVKLLFSNSIGVPVGLSFSMLYAMDRSGNHFPFVGPGVPDLAKPRIINYPSLNQIGKTVKDSLVLDKSNSNLSDVLASNPVLVNVNATAVLNSPTVSGTTFINYNSEYSVGASIELPLWGKGGLIELIDTMSFNYPKTSLLAPDRLEQLIIHINITNSFPVSVQPQIYLLDGNNMLIDSLFTGNLKIEGATDINNDGIADPHLQDPLDIVLSGSRIDNLYKTRRFLVKGKLSTTNFPVDDVRFYLSYFLDIKLGLIGKLKINPGK